MSGLFYFWKGITDGFKIFEIKYILRLLVKIYVFVLSD